MAGDREIMEAGSEGLTHDIASGANSGIAKSFWGTIDKLFKAYGIAKDAEASFKLNKHFIHRSQGTKYDYDCDVCKA